MTRRIMALLMAMVMVFGFGVVSHAEENGTKHYKGIMAWVFPSTSSGQGEAEEIEIFATFADDIFEFKFEDSKGNYIEWKGEYWIRDNYVHVVEMRINGETAGTGAGLEFNSDFTIAKIVSRGFATDSTPFRFDAEFNLSTTPVDEVRYFKVSGGVYMEKRGYDGIEDFRGEFEIENGILETSINYQKFTFETELGNHCLYVYPESESKQDFDGLSYPFHISYRLFVFNGDTFEMWKTAGHTEEAYFSLSPAYSYPLSLVEFYPEEPTEPSVHKISSPFTGTALSDRDEYTLALAGYFEKELADGTYVLTSEEINAQTISIVAYNKASGVKRVMTQSTIEEMSVTVVNGVVTEYTIHGRVQTSGGKLDRYTAVINN